MHACINDEGLEKVREAFIKHCHARFMEYFFCHIPFGRKEVYAKEVMKASLERLARLIKVCGFLLQTKVYLFWSLVHERTEKRKRAQL